MKWLLFFLFPTTILAQQPEINFTKLSLDVRFDTLNSQVHGRVEHTFTQTKQVDSIFLNGINMQYNTVLLNGKQISYSSSQQGIWLLPDVLLDTNKLELTYTCIPRKGIFFVGFNDSTGRAKRQIWTQGQGTDHRHWIPHKDDQNDKVLLDLKITVPKRFTVMANGALKSKITLDAKTTRWHYTTQKPMSSYLLAIVAGEYSYQKSFSQSRVPLTQYFYPERQSDYPLYYLKNEAIFNFLQDEIGVPFPWENYKQAPVANFQHGAMENTMATIFGDFFMADSLALPDRNYPYVNAHELAHQWFGNLVTATGSEHHWLHEGFATYYQWLAEEQLYGTQHFDWQRKLGADQVFAAALLDSVPLLSGKAGSARFYQKGAWVLHMMQQNCPNFKAAVQAYLEEHAFKNVTTNDLLSTFKQYNCDFTAFADVWLSDSTEAHYVVEQIALKNNALQITVQQTQGTLRNVHPPIKLVYKSGKSEVVSPTLGNNTITLSEKLLFWEFNPNMALLVKHSSVKDAKFWKAQYSHYHKAEYDKYMLSRYGAVEQLDSKKYASFLVHIAENESEFYAIRGLAFAKLIELNYNKYVSLIRKFLLKTYQDKAYEVYQNLPLKKQLLLLLTDESEETKELVQTIRLQKSYELREMLIHKAINAKEPKKNQWLFDEEYAKNPGINGQNVYLTSLTYRYYLLNDTVALTLIKDRTTPSFDFLTRINAMENLQAIGYFDASLMPAYLEALFNTNRKLLRAARATLTQSYQTQNGKAIIDAYLTINASTFNSFQERMVALTFSP